MTVATYAALGLDIVPGTGLLPRARARRLRCLDADAARLRHAGSCATSSATPSAMPSSGAHVVPRIAATIEPVRPLFETDWPSSRRALAAERHGPKPDKPFTQPGDRRDLSARSCREAEAAGATASRRSRRRGMPCIAASSPRRSTVSTAAAEPLDTSGRRPSRAADRRRHGRLARGAWRSRSRYDYRGHTVLKMRPLVPGPGVAATRWRCSKASTSARWTRSAPISSTPWSRR